MFVFAIGHGNSPPPRGINPKGYTKYVISACMQAPGTNPKIGDLELP